MLITIIDYGMGNSSSIQNILRKVGYDSVITSDLEIISNSNFIILPGVGSFDYGMKKLSNSGIQTILSKKVIKEKTPFLGICLGMQLLFNTSEEGTANGLGWLKGNVKKFNNQEDRNLKIPHMGWNYISLKTNNNLFQQNPDNPDRFYFVHSYYVECQDNENILTTTNYINEFVSSVKKDNIYGVQFHPEKSHKFGMFFFKNLIESHCKC
ncbi:imidazole glycerol phosphate synthase subunit HisH [Photorhabdus heterorhabditis]|uniref:imidazole glycerol phosphate synthase subunit HisH n=1 Tax=Photorhabdus heterorhabditis TaxID=880156 RepID=UPI001BD6DA90|nr:imidazole glycerol phosphate synthase subunit HisH [Photorhabdus heterorhabditis]MBS9442725.1 imidazole glycerol phosphate synthase subunit HisH [Photorhabdus heterorhabditis]